MVGTIFCVILAAVSWAVLKFGAPDEGLNGVAAFTVIG